MKKAGVKLVLPSNADKKIAKDLDEAYQGAMRSERIVESDAARQRRHREEQEALANTIELVDLRELARKKDAARQRKAAEAAAERENSMAEQIRRKKEEEAQEGTQQSRRVRQLSDCEFPE